MTKIKSYITINRMRVYARHGVLPVEQKVGNEFEVTVHLAYDAERAMVTDNASAALNYARVMDVINDQMKNPAHLLEHAAYNIYTALTIVFPNILSGHIVVTKLHPPVAYQTAGASFTLDWTT